jgi:hypothetical protein
MQTREHAGFAVVEALVVGVIAAIVIAFAITIVFSVTDRTSQVAVCRGEAQSFQDAVINYHDRHDPHMWPDPKEIHSVAQLAEVLSLKDGLSGGSKAIAHLDGSQRTPVVISKHGWKYDFEKHTVDTSACG